MKDTVKVDTQLDKPSPGDIYVLCSDGLCGPATDDDIEEIVLSHPTDLKTAAARLIEKANERGGPDNITVVLAKVMGIG
jgi:protein phosphatase